MWVCISSSFFQAVCFIAKSGCQDLRILCSTELQLKFYPNVHLTLDMWLKKSLRDTFISVTAHLCDESSKGSIHSKKKQIMKQSRCETIYRFLVLFAVHDFTYTEF